MHEVVSVVEIGGISLSGPDGSSEEALCFVTCGASKEAYCTGLETVVEGCSGLGGVVLEVDVNTKEVTDSERFTELDVVEHPLVLVEVIGGSVEVR